jgi:hypothetical protein
VRSLSTAIKSLSIFRKLSKIFNVTRPLQEHRLARLSKSRRRGNRQRTRGSSVQRLSSLISLLKWRMTNRKLAQAPVVTNEQVHPLLAGSEALQEVSKVFAQTEGKEVKKERVWMCEAFIAIFAMVFSPS